MKTTPIRTLASAVVLAFFLLIAWATSYEDEDFPNFSSVYLFNNSDSCQVIGVNYVHRVRRDDTDTLTPTPFILNPGDSLLNRQERLRLEKILFTCSCPNTNFLQEMDIVLDSTYFARIDIDCD